MPPLVAAKPNEAERLHEYRLEVALASGLTRAEAFLFAGSEASLADLRRLLDKGATPGQAVKILV